MGRFLKYAGVFTVAVAVLQLLVFDSMRVWIYFCPLSYIAFVILLPVEMKPVGVLFLSLVTGAFVDFFEGTAGLHTAVTLFTAFSRRWVMALTVGREGMEEASGMPSVKSLGRGRFMRYASLAVFMHCLLFFSLEALTWRGYPAVLIKTALSGAVTLVAVWAVMLLFTVRTPRRR